MFRAKQIAQLNRKDFQEKLEEIISIVKKALIKIEKIGDYELKELPNFCWGQRWHCNSHP